MTDAQIGTQINRQIDRQCGGSRSTGIYIDTGIVRLFTSTFPKDDNYLHYYFETVHFVFPFWSKNIYKHYFWK